MGWSGLYVGSVGDFPHQEDADCQDALHTTKSGHGCRSLHTADEQTSSLRVSERRRRRGIELDAYSQVYRMDMHSVGDAQQTI